MQSSSQCCTVATQVHVVRPDGFYWPAALEGRCSTDMFTVTFDNGQRAEVPRDCIVGTGFQTLNDVHLKRGQRVVCCIGGHELEADVIDQQRGSVSVALNDGREVVVQNNDLRFVSWRRRGSLDDGYTSASPDTLSLSGLSPK